MVELKKGWGIPKRPFHAYSISDLYIVLHQNQNSQKSAFWHRRDAQSRINLGKNREVSKECNEIIWSFHSYLYKRVKIVKPKLFCFLQTSHRCKDLVKFDVVRFGQPGMKRGWAFLFLFDLCTGAQGVVTPRSTPGLCILGR